MRVGLHRSSSWQALKRGRLANYNWSRCQQNKGRIRHGQDLLDICVSGLCTYLARQWVLQPTSDSPKGESLALNQLKQTIVEVASSRPASIHVSYHFSSKETKTPHITRVCETWRIRTFFIRTLSSNLRLDRGVP